MLSLLAVLAASAMALAASASAAEYVICKNVGTGNGTYQNSKCETKGGSKEWERFPIATGESIGAKGESGSMRLKVTIASTAIEIECKKGTSSSSLESGGKSGASSISFKECKLYTGLKKCKLTSSEETEIPTTFHEAQLEEEDGRLIDRFEPKGSENTFVTITIESVDDQVCGFWAGSWEITGSHYCEVDEQNSEAETFKEDHELICNASGSELYLGSKANQVTLTTTGGIELSGGDYWAIK